MRLEHKTTKEIANMDDLFTQVKETETKKSNSQLIFELVREYPRQIATYYAKLAHRRWAYISEESVIATLTALKKKDLIGATSHERAMGIAGRKVVHQYYPLVKEYPDTAAIKLANLKKGQEKRKELLARGITGRKKKEATPVVDSKPVAKELVHVKRDVATEVKAEPHNIVIPTGKLTAELLMETMSIKTAREIYDELKKVFG